MISLDRLFKEIGTVTIPSVKAEVHFDTQDGALWVIYREHKPDGSYADAITYKFQLTDD